MSIHLLTILLVNRLISLSIKSQKILSVLNVTASYILFCSTNNPNPISLLYHYAILLLQSGNSFSNTFQVCCIQ